MLVAKYLEETLENKGDEYFDEDTKTGLVKACGCWFLTGVLDGMFIVGVIVTIAGWIMKIKNLFKKD